MKKIFVLVVLFAGMLPVMAEADTFKWSCKVDQLKNQRYKIEVKCLIARDSYLSSESVKVEVAFADKSTTVIKSPPATPNKNGELIYPAGVCRWVMFAGKEPIKVTADFQGCINDMCLMPETRTVWEKKNSPSKVPSNNPSFAVNDPSSSSKVPSGDPSVSKKMTTELAVALKKYEYVGKLAGVPELDTLKVFLKQGKSDPAKNDAAVEESAEMGFWAILLLVVLGGLGLNLTPCVLPMIPINLAIIGADSSNGKFRGFRRGAAYGLGITLAYGVLGLLAALTGSRFGELNSSSIFNWAIAVIFLLLSLGMFGVYELDLSRFTNLFGSKKSKEKQRKLPPELTAFGLGITAALLAGACVAPVVITVILLSAKLYSEGNFWGLALPFALGLAMALPWPLLGAGLSFLPKPGMWMVRVKQIFGVIIAAMAIYYGYLGWSLRSGAFDQSKELKDLAAKLENAAENKQTVLIDCWATWCKNCKALDQLLESENCKALLKDSRVKLIRFQAEKLNDPQVAALLDKYQIRGLPALILLKSK